MTSTLFITLFEHHILCNISLQSLIGIYSLGVLTVIANNESSLWSLPMTNYIHTRPYSFAQNFSDFKPPVPPVGSSRWYCYNLCYHDTRVLLRRASLQRWMSCSGEPLECYTGQTLIVMVWGTIRYRTWSHLFQIPGTQNSDKPVTHHQGSCGTWGPATSSTHSTHGAVFQ